MELDDHLNIEQGDSVMTIGYPLGDDQIKLTTGIISGFHQSSEKEGGSRYGSDNIEDAYRRNASFLQITAPLNPGNSGGPLVNLNGEVIGINTAVVFLAENVGFAIPINPGKKDLEDVQKYGKIKIPFLGVRYIPITKKMKKQYNLPVDYGALLVPMGLERPIVAGGPADKAGIEEGDIILGIGKDKVSIKNPLEEILQRFQVGDEIELKVLRGKKQLKLKAKLGERK